MKRLIEISIKNVFRNKIILLSSILLGLLLGLSTLISTFYSTMDNFLNNDIMNNKAFRTLLVREKSTEKSDKKIRKELLNVEYIDSVFAITSKYNVLISTTFENKEKDITGLVELDAGINKTIPNIIKGRSIKKGEDDYIICPKNFYPGQINKNLSRLDFIKLDKYLNKRISFEVENYSSNKKKKMTFKLIGLYENSKSENDENICYVSEKSLFNIFKYQRLNDDLIKLENQKGYYIEVNKIKNVKTVQKELNELGYAAKSLAFVDYTIFKNIYKKAKKISLIFLIFALLLFLSIEIKFVFENKKIYMLFNYLGARNKKIISYNYISNIVFLIISYMFTLISIIFINIILRLVLYFKPLIFDKMTLLINYNSLPILILLTLLASLLISFWSSIYIKKEINE